MMGYYKNEKATAEVLEPDGWLHTGDMGTTDDIGTIFIRGRCKSMLLGSNGQNIYPEEIEARLNNMRCVMESLIVDRNGRLVALRGTRLRTGRQRGRGPRETTGNHE